MENNKSNEVNKSDAKPVVVTHRVYGGRAKSVGCVAMAVIRSIMPARINGKNIARGIQGINDYVTSFTMPWRDYKVDVTFTSNANERPPTCICTCTPTTSQMVIRASSAPIKDFESRNLISANLWRAGFEMTRGRWLKRQYKYKGDITLENVLRIAKQIHDKTTSATFAATVKQVLGTVLTLGLTTEKKPTRFYLNRLEDNRITFIDESEILPYLDEDGVPWHSPNPNLGRKTWYTLYPVSKTSEGEGEEEGAEDEQNDNAAEQPAEPAQGSEQPEEIDVRDELVCFHWLQKICNKGDQCTYLHTMKRK